MQDLIKDGTVARGWLGVEIQPVTSDIAESLGLSADKGALVASVQDSAPAKKAGIVAGDVITQVDGKDVQSSRDLARMIGAYQPGKSVDVTLWRSGKSETVKVDLGTMPGASQQASAGDEQSAPSQEEGQSLADLGLTVTKADDGRGLVVTDVDPDSAAADRGIQAGDVIVAVNSQEVNGSEDVSKAMAEAEKAGRKSVLVQITRDDANRFVALPLGKG